MKGQYSKCKRPKTAKELEIAIKKGAPIDHRTRVGKAIRDVKTAVRCNLNETARALLEQDIAFSQTIQQMCIEKAFADPNKAITEDGKQSKALSTLKQYAMLKKACLLALKKFHQTESKEETQKTLADVIIETSDIDA